MRRKILHVAFLLSALHVSFTLKAGILNISLKNAIAKKMVNVQATSNGGFMGKGVSLQLFNNTPFALNIRIEPGLIFRPVDTSYQNLVVVGDENVRLESKDKATIALQTFCGKSYAHAPRSGLDYKFWKQGDSAMVKVVQFIKKNGLYNYVGQSAVWALTNGHAISSIYDHSEISKKLAAYVASLTKRKAPSFYTKNNVSETEGSVPYDPTIDKYYVDIVWKDASARNMHIYVEKEDGSLLWEEKKDSISNAGHKTIVELDPKKLSKGTYIVKLQDDDNYIWQRTEVVIE